MANIEIFGTLVRNDNNTNRDKIVQATQVEGGYFVCESLPSTGTWATGQLCYVAGTVNKFYQYNGSTWVVALSYAGSSIPGGAANSANKLNSNAGDSNTPVYFTGGKPVACTSLALNTTGNAATASKLKDNAGSYTYTQINSKFADLEDAIENDIAEAIGTINDTIDYKVYHVNSGFNSYKNQIHLLTYTPQNNEGAFGDIAIVYTVATSTGLSFDNYSTEGGELTCSLVGLGTCSDTEIVIPAETNYNGKFYKVTAIGESAFENKSNITSISIPSSITKIDTKSFKGCSRLTNITVPNSVTTIGSAAFNNCTSLAELTVPFVGNGSDDKKYLGYIFGAEDPDYDECTKCIPAKLAKVTVTNNKGSTIDKYAFMGCSGLEDVDFNTIIAKVDDYAFYGCEALVAPQHYINPYLTSIGNYAFYGCEALRYIDKLRALESIGENAFDGCINLSTVEIGKSVKFIGKQAFNGCNLDYVTFDEENAENWYILSQQNDTEGKLIDVSTPSINAEYLMSTYCDSYWKQSSNISCTHEKTYEAEENRVEATCTTDGSYDLVTYCSDCRDELSRETIAISKLGHSFTNYVSNGDATCLADGTETAKCDRCDVTDTQTEVGSALGHSFTNYVYNEDATCTEDGTETAKCDRCDATDTQTAVGTAPRHNYDDNCECTNCGDIKYSEGLVFAANEDNTCYVAGYGTCTDKVVVIPPEDAEGRTVVAIGEEAFIDQDIERVILPDTVIAIYDKAFQSCGSLQEISGSNIETIGNFAFERTALGFDADEFVFGAGIKEIGIGAFSGCDNLEKVIFEDGCEAFIQDRAFYCCANLKSVKIPDSIVYIGDEVFADVNDGQGLSEDLYTDDGIAYYLGNEDNNYVMLYKVPIPSKDTITPSYLKIKDGTKFIGDEALLGNDAKFVQCIYIPDSVIAINRSAFKESAVAVTCDNVGKPHGLFMIPKNVIKIGAFAFYLSSVQYMTFEEYFDWAGNYTDNEYFTEMTIEAGQFYASSTEEIAQLFIQYDSAVLTWDRTTEFSCEHEFEEVLGSNKWPTCTEPGHRSDRKCTKCGYVEPGETIAAIGHTEVSDNNGYSATCETPGKTSSTHCSVCGELITKQENIPSLGHEYQNGKCIRCGKDSDVSYSVGLSYEPYDDESCTVLDRGECLDTELVIPDSIEIDGKVYQVTKIDSFAFENDYMTSVVIPDSVTSIGNNAFEGCISLTSIVIPDSVTDIEAAAFYNCTQLTDVVIGNNVKTIYNYAFYNCTSLMSVVIPDSVESIYQDVFKNCSDLSTIVIGEGVINIGANAFEGCQDLYSITFENIDGWIAVSQSDDTSILLELTQNDSANAEYLKQYTTGYDWHRDMQ